MQFLARQEAVCEEVKENSFTFGRVRIQTTDGNFRCLNWKLGSKSWLLELLQLYLRMDKTKLNSSAWIHCKTLGLRMDGLSWTKHGSQ